MSRATPSDPDDTQHTGSDRTPTRSGDVPVRLVSVATELFAKHGFESTSVQSIVDAAGVTKGAMYHYFDSKDDLLYEIYGRMLRVQTAQLERVASADLPVTERIRAATVDVIETSIANFDDTKIFWRSMHQLHPDKQAQVRAERRYYHERFRALIQEGQDSGEFRADVPADLVVDYHFGAVHHLSTWYRKDGWLGAGDVGRYFADMLLSALRP
ncbi:TetR/AcrR family transcriptional regulator [Haloechinothrix sp. YIM 98757]|uniref:TetR/AcrR family transcriptional regulator n=1 Tax=Haloechinothrix aidingensis TaxID=2752311 RepID=A0A838A8X7_9PSEU|nr:TetR/AcrR family transcriptional regulator [Haloechinothrix aidingensis]MBA0124989.1 TetR/AcrR family transcriptional regulator [Haloechinothrix aidingensis]